MPLGFFFYKDNLTETAATPEENLSISPESDQSVSSVPSAPSVQTPSDTAAPVEQVGEQGNAETAEKSSGDSKKIISKITSAKAGSRERIMAFTELPDGTHTVNGRSFTKKGNLFTLDDKTLNAKEIEKATRTTSEKMRKTVEETVSDAGIGSTTNFPPSANKVLKNPMPAISVIWHTVKRC